MCGEKEVSVHLAFLLAMEGIEKSEQTDAIDFFVVPAPQRVNSE